MAKAGCGVRDRRFILQAAMALLLVTALVLLGAGRAGSDNEPGRLQHTATATAASVSIKIGADLIADDGTGEIAPWAFSYNATDDPTHLTVEVAIHQTACGSDTPVVTYSTALNLNAVDDLITWLTGVKDQIKAQSAR